MKEQIEKLEHGLMICEATGTLLVHIEKADAEKILCLLKEQKEDIDELQNRATEEKLKAKEAEQESVIEALKSDLDETLAVLGEQSEIVLCRDCKYWDKTTREEGNDCISGPWENAVCDILQDWDRYGELGEDFSRTNGDWFCADGERKDNG